MTSKTRRAPGHLAILASAGSGKTTRLTRRYIRLLADGDLKLTPSRICALTFTRKAAGEIFDRIVGYLCDGAAGGESAAALAEQLEMPDLDEREFGRLLRLFLDSLHRAVIGTMDSFVFGVARAFPIELGIPTVFRATESDRAEGREMRQEILADIIASARAGGRGVGEFFEAFKRATFGSEERKVSDLLEQVVTKLHLAYRLCPEKNKWGNAKLIWTGKRKPPLRLYPRDELLREAEVVTHWIERQLECASIGNDCAAKLLDTARALAGHGMSSAWDARFSGVMFDKLLSQLDSLRRGEGVISYRGNEISFPPGVARSLGVLMGNLVAVEMKRALEKTAGLHDLLEYYDIAYEKESRESGRFSFTDIQRLLAMGDISRNALPISIERKEGRLFIDYRLDARLDHWLLDEFQDTSDLQWAIFDNLVSELVQGDPQGRGRSFFYVGDVKQSIYRWRGGNPGLFLGIQERYNRAGQIIHTETMSDSYRCSQPVIDAVNQVFSNLPADHLPAGAIAAWSTVWSKHGTLNKEARSFAALLQHEYAEDSEAARYQLAANLLNEIQPVARGIEVGILTRTNEACSEIVNILRRECPGIGFVHEGKFGIVENELAQVLLSLIRLAAHPGNSFAWQHVLMSPLARVLEEEKITRDAIAPRLLAEIEAGGFRSFISEWARRLDEMCPLNDYGRHCVSKLEKAAAGFDAAGSRSCNGFLRFIEDFTVQEEAARGSVRIMTIHQAKGLGFDMVILPQLQHKSRMSMTKADWSDKEMIYGGRPFAPDWILKSPKSAIAENDEVLNKRLKQIDEGHCFDWLCLLYVAMTRARNALYMITSPANETSAFRPANLLKLALAGEVEPKAEPNITINNTKCARLYSAASGDENWYEAFPMKTSATAGAAITASRRGTDFAGRASRRQTLQRLEPSRLEFFERNASDLFDPETTDILDFGSAIHELFEKIEWMDDENSAEAIIADWRPACPYDPGVLADAISQFRACFASPEFRRALAQPPGNVELWREKHFETVLDGRWVSGIFDRVTITRNESGKPVDAVILDFKSNRRLDTEVSIRETAEHYRPQMELYRRALSRILDLPGSRISLQLLFTVPARVVCLT